jgi:predicted GNAT family N-acyltransferase
VGEVMKVIIAKDKKEIIDHFYVRGTVFIKEQGIDWDIEFDGLDKDCVLFNALIDGKVVGAARLHHNKVGRVATLLSYRKMGVGKALMQEIEKYAFIKDMNHLVLNAQMPVKSFYEKLGYKAVGTTFYEADIPHVKMIKTIKK